MAEGPYHGHEYPKRHNTKAEGSALQSDLAWILTALIVGAIVVNVFFNF